MRVVLVLFFLLVWSGFVLGTGALLMYLGLKAFASGRHRIDRDTASVRAPHPWRPSEKLLAAGTVAGAAYWTAQLLSFSTYGWNLLFAAGPALVFAVLAAISTVVSRRSGLRTEADRSAASTARTSLPSSGR